MEPGDHGGRRPTGRVCKEEVGSSLSSSDLHCHGNSLQPCMQTENAPTPKKFGSRHDYSRSDKLVMEISATLQRPCNHTKYRQYFRDNFFSFLHTTKLKLIRPLQPGFSQTAHFISLLLGNLRLREAKIVRSLVLSLLLFVVLGLPTVGARDGVEYREKSQSSSPFETWITGEVEPDQVSADTTRQQVVRFPDFILPASKLFRFQPPSEVGVALHYKVCETRVRQRTDKSVGSVGKEGG